MPRDARSTGIVQASGEVAQMIGNDPFRRLRAGAWHRGDEHRRRPHRRDDAAELGAGRAERRQRLGAAAPARAAECARRHLPHRPVAGGRGPQPSLPPRRAGHRAGAPAQLAAQAFVQSKVTPQRQESQRSAPQAPPQQRIASRRRITPIRRLDRVLMAAEQVLFQADIDTSCQRPISGSWSI